MATRSTSAAASRIFVFGHIGGDDEYGKVDQSIVMDSFRLSLNVELQSADDQPLPVSR